MKNYRRRTQLIHGGTKRSSFGETSEAIYLSSGYVYDSAEQGAARFRGDEEGFIYSRYANPSVRMFEERMALLEGAEDARATATGMAAVTASLLCQLQQGDHIVSAKALFGSCRFVIEDILPRYGIECTLVNGTDLEAWQKAVRKNTKLFFLESPSNPLLEVLDIKAISEIAHKAGAQLLVDNVFATPWLQKPLALGADISIYSATKHIDGQGRCLGGIILGTSEFIEETLANYLRQTGPALSPFNAWVLLKGLETLELRINAQCDNAEHLVKFLSKQKQVKQVLYPGLKTHPQYKLAQKQMERNGSLLSFELEGGEQRAFAFCNALRLILISNNLGDSRTLITHPTTTTHHRLGEEGRLELGITGGILRISAGLEDAQDITEDIAHALEQAYV